MLWLLNCSQVCPTYAVKKRVLIDWTEEFFDMTEEYNGSNSLKKPEFVVVNRASICGRDDNGQSSDRSWHLNI